MTKFEEALSEQPLAVRLVVSLVIVLIGLYALYMAMGLILPLIYNLGYLFGEFMAGVL